MQKGFFIETGKKGETPIFATCTKDEVAKIYKSMEEKGMSSLLNCVEYVCAFIEFYRYYAKKKANEPMVHIVKESGEIATKTYEEIRFLAECFSKGLDEYGLCPRTEADAKKIKILGVLIHNCWMAPIVIVGCYYGDCTGVYIYADPPDHYHYNVNKGLFDTMFVSTPMLNEYLKPLEAKDIRVVKNLILDENAPADAVAKLKGYGINIFYFNDIIEKGKQSSLIPERLKPDSDVYVVSTSGSTGNPKGAVLGHDCVFYNSTIRAGPWGKYINEDSYMANNVTLGFASVLGFNTTSLTRGGKLVYVEKKCASYIEEIKLARPTFIMLSPLGYNKIYQGIMDKINSMPSPHKEGILKILEIKSKIYDATKQYVNPDLDKNLEPLKKGLFGDRINILMNVGATLSPEVIRFFRVLTSTPLINIYGSSELGGLCTTGADTDPCEIVGTPNPWFEFKLVDIPEKAYLSTDKPYPRGEVYVRGPFMSRYLNEPTKTNETIKDGWLLTGDVAVLKEDFKLQLIDRKNQVIKLTCVRFSGLSKLEI